MVPDLIHNGPLGPALPTTQDRELGTAGTLGILFHLHLNLYSYILQAPFCIKRCMSLLVLFIDG